MSKIVIVSGGFDPLHSGHIAMFKSARELGDKLVVAVNSDEWLTRKKGRSFMPFHERCNIIDALGCVDQVIGFNDDDDTACNAIFQILSTKRGSDTVVFANGGDRTKENIPEMIYDKVEFVFGIGGEDKKNSSSWILKEWKNPKVTRLWGTYTVLDTNGYWRVKELSIDIGKSLSDQRHFIRSEHWHIVSGELEMDLEFQNGYKTSKIYKRGDSIDIPVKTWHKATNVGSVPVKVIEVWQGNTLSEEDIERRSL